MLYITLRQLMHNSVTRVHCKLQLSSCVIPPKNQPETDASKKQLSKVNSNYKYRQQFNVWTTHYVHHDWREGVGEGTSKPSSFCQSPSSSGITTELLKTPPATTAAATGSPWSGSRRSLTAGTFCFTRFVCFVSVLTGLLLPMLSILSTGPAWTSFLASSQPGAVIWYLNTWKTDSILI